MYAALTLPPDFFLRNALSLAIPHAVLLLGAPPEMVGLCVALYAPMPLRTTALAVATLTLFFGFWALNSRTLSFMISLMASLNRIDAPEDLDAALPFLFTLLPLIRYDLGAGVCAALFGPLRFIYICNFIWHSKNVCKFVMENKIN